MPPKKTNPNKTAAKKPVVDSHVAAFSSQLSNVSSESDGESSGGKDKRGLNGSAEKSHDANQFFDADGHGGSGMSSPSQESAIPLTEQEKEELRNDLQRVESEIQTLRSVLNARMKEASEIRRKLGISAFKEIGHDMSEGIRTLKETPAYQKTGEILHTVGEKTTTAFTSVGKKLGELRTTPYFKSFEDKMGSAYTNVKTKIANSTSMGGLSGHYGGIPEEGGPQGSASQPTTPQGGKP